MNRNEQTLAPNAYRLLWAGFVAILAAGIGFAIRGGILDNWQKEFGFTGGQLGLIGSAGLTGFCFGIIIGGIVVDKIGYGKLVLAAFLFHFSSAVIAFCALPGTSQGTAFNLLFIGTFIFALANGTLEAVANPLVATLFPHNRTHYLNILHASWPLGLVLGSVIGWVLDDHFQLDWKIQLGLYLIATVIYGLMFFGQKYPRSEASEKGLSLGEMFRDVGMLGSIIIASLLVIFVKDNLGGALLSELTGSAFFRSTTWTYVSIGAGVAIWLGFSAISGWSMGSVLLTVLFVAHALVGAVELGTDSWIQNITGNILTSSEGKILFAFTSLTMFLLRFCADFIEKRIGLSPVAILLVCSVLACAALNVVSGINGFTYALLALTLYGIGKTFFWPTMLAVAGDRFPRSGAVAMSIMGGIGMLSGGLIGSVGLGYAKDRFAGQELRTASEEVFEKYRAQEPTSFLMFTPQVGLDGKKFGAIAEKKQAGEELTADEAMVHAASIAGDRRTLVADSAIPAAMAVIYLGMLLYFKAIGGYRPLRIDET